MNMGGNKMSGTIWSVPQMEVVTDVSFVLPNSCRPQGRGRGGLCFWESFEVCPVSATRVVVMVFCGDHDIESLVVSDKNLEGEWACHHLLNDCLAYDCEDGNIAATAGHNKVTIWDPLRVLVMDVAGYKENHDKMMDLMASISQPVLGFGCG